MWTDDHEPPTPTTAWKPGQTVEYSRTMFVPMYPYVGPAKIIVGIYDTHVERAAQARQHRTAATGRITVAEFELLPQTENVYLIYKDGWHPAEVAPDNPAIEWKWTRKEATVAFRNPKRDSTFIVQMDNPSRAAGAATEVEVRIGDQSLGTVPCQRRRVAGAKIPAVGRAARAPATWSRSGSSRIGPSCRRSSRARRATIRASSVSGCFMRSFNRRSSASNDLPMSSSTCAR